MSALPISTIIQAVVEPRDSTDSMLSDRDRFDPSGDVVLCFLSPRFSLLEGESCAGERPRDCCGCLLFLPFPPPLGFAEGDFEREGFLAGLFSEALS